MKLLRQKLEKVAAAENIPSISISFNTHLTFRHNQQDKIVLKNLVRDVSEALVAKFGKRETASLLGN